MPNRKQYIDTDLETLHRYADPETAYKYPENNLSFLKASNLS